MNKIIDRDLKKRIGVMRKTCIYKAGHTFQLTVKQVDILLATRTDENVRFYALPTLELMGLTKEGKNNIVKDMVKKYRQDISRGLPLLIDQIIFIRLMLDRLDKRNKFVLEKCNIYFDGFISKEFWL